MAGPVAGKGRADQALATGVLPDWECLLALDGRVELIGATREQADIAGILAEPWVNVWPTEARDRAGEAIEAARAGKPARFDAHGLAYAGSRHWDVTVSPLFDADGAVSRLLTHARDISHHQADEEAGDLQQQLAHESRLLAEVRTRASHNDKLRLLGQFVGNLVHDLNNVFATSHSATTLLRRRHAPPGATEILDHLEQAIARGTQMTRRLLDFSRQDAGDAGPIDLAALIRRDKGLMDHLVGSERTIILALDDQVPPVVAVPSQLQSVLFNLLANSRDAMADGGMIVIALTHETQGDNPADPGRVVLSISDDGHGMPADVLAQLGNPFFTTKQPGHGTGLGVLSAFEFVARANGTIELDSAPGTGTRLRLILPVADA